MVNQDWKKEHLHVCPDDLLGIASDIDMMLPSNGTQLVHIYILTDVFWNIKMYNSWWY